MLPPKSNHYLSNSSHLDSLIHTSTSIQQNSYQELKKHLISMTNTNQQLVSLNQQIRYQNEYLNKQISFLNEKVQLLELQNKRLHRLIQDDRILTVRSNRSMDYKSEQLAELAELLDGGKRQLEKRNEQLQGENIELRTLNEKYKLSILQLQTDNFEFKQNLKFLEEKRKVQDAQSTNTKSDNIVNKNSRFLKHELRQEKNHPLMESPSVMDILQQGDISSVEGINSSQESYTKEQVIEQLRQQNYLLRNEICQNNHRYQTQIQKLNLYIDKLLLKQSQNQGIKTTVSTLFNALTVSFIDFSNQKSQYQKKIVQVLNQLSTLKGRQKQLKTQIKTLKDKLQYVQYESNLLKR